MPRYSVYVELTVEVDADNEEEAIEKVRMHGPIIGDIVNEDVVDAW